MKRNLLLMMFFLVLFLIVFLLSYLSIKLGFTLLGILPKRFESPLILILSFLSIMRMIILIVRRKTI